MNRNSFTAQGVQRAISAALAQDRAARSREWRAAWGSFGSALGIVGGITACVLQPWFLIPAALFGLFALSVSENRVASFVWRWAWMLIGLGLYALAALTVLRWFWPQLPR